MPDRVLILSDLHCGHRSGLTPPRYQGGEPKYVRSQDEKWRWFEEALIEAAPWNKVVWVGDLVDGLGVKNSSEIILADLNQQINCAVDIIETVGCPKNLFLYGTMTHTATKDGLEIERIIAQQINGKENPMIYSQAWFKLGKHVIDARHAPACGSGVPHTRANPIMRERMANEQWHMKGYQPLADIYLRGHLHYKFMAGSPGTWQGWNLPALQTPKTKYGRRLSNTVDVGISILEENDKWPIYEIYEAPIRQEEVLNW